MDTCVICCGDSLKQLQKPPDVLDYTNGPLREIDRHFKVDRAVIIPLTVKDILDGQIAREIAWICG